MRPHDKLAANAEVRFGVIGCGVIAYWTHLRELKRLRGARLIAAADPDPAARERASRLARIPTHAEPAQLLARSDIDAVVICAPTHLHADLAMDAARAGKHVYLEKPIATSAGDARRLAEAVRQSGIRVAIGFNRRCHPMYVQARALIASGALGEIRTVFSSFIEPLARDSMPVWKRARSTGGGVLLDLAPHRADLLRWFLNGEAAEVEAQVHSRATEHDEAWIGITLDNGFRAQSYFSFRAGRADFLEFVGEKGTLRVDRHDPALSLKLARRFGYGVRNARVFPSRESLAWRMVRLARPSYESSYRMALTDFARTIHGEAPRGATLEDGWRSLEIVLAAEEASRQGHAVTMSPVSL
jgi:predicted dehydrogenase